MKLYCDLCGSPVMHEPLRIEGRDLVFCSYYCRDKAKAKLRIL